MFDKLHFDVCEIIAQNQDIKSLSSLIRTCKKATLHRNLMNEKIDNLTVSYIQRIVEQIRAFDAKCTQVWKERLALQVMIDLGDDIENENKQSLQAIMYVVHKIRSQYSEYDLYDIFHAWKKSHYLHSKESSETPLVYTESENNIIQATIKTLALESRIYILPLEFNCSEGTEKYSMEMTFDMTEKPTITFMIEDYFDETKGTTNQVHIDTYHVETVDKGYIEVPMDTDGYVSITNILKHVTGSNVFINHLTRKPSLHMPYGLFGYSIRQLYVTEHIKLHAVDDKIASVCDYRLYI